MIAPKYLNTRHYVLYNQRQTVTTETTIAHVIEHNHTESWQHNFPQTPLQNTSMVKNTH